MTDIRQCIILGGLHLLRKVIVTVLWLLVLQELLWLSYEAKTKTALAAWPRFVNFETFREFKRSGAACRFPGCGVTLRTKSLESCTLQPNLILEQRVFKNYSQNRETMLPESYTFYHRLNNTIFNPWFYRLS